MPKKLALNIFEGFSIESASPEQTLQAGSRLGKILEAGTLLLLEGPLGSGKTVFVKGIGQALGIKNPNEIRSPTFDLIQEHQGKKGMPLCHVDLYRLKATEIGQIGLEEYWSPPWIVAVEWGEKLKSYLPAGSENILWIRFKALAPLKREITFSGSSLWKEKLKKCCQKF